VGTGSFLGVERPGRGVNHSPASTEKAKERVKKRVELYFYFPSGLLGLFWGELYFYCAYIPLEKLP
jgi:hypothetical protein